MACTPDRKIKVYLQDGLLIIDKGNGLTIGPANPGLFTPTYIDTEFSYNDRVSLKNGSDGFTDVSPERIARQDGTFVGDTEAVMAYFTSLGIGKTSNNTAGTVKSVNNLLPDAEGNVTITLPFATLTQLALLAARVSALEQQAGFTQLDTPEPITGTITETTAQISWGSISNADSYDIYLNDSFLTNVSTINYSFAGLIAGADYTAGVVAKGSGLYLNSDLGTVQFSTTGITPPQNTLPYTLPFILS